LDAMMGLGLTIGAESTMDVEVIIGTKDATIALASMGSSVPLL
jgi:hypothetical protein